MASMRRVVILGRGGSGKSTFAARLGSDTGLPVIELDQHFWRPGPEATPPDRWAAVQAELARGEVWIMEGDLGPHDVPEVRLRAADTVILLDFPFWRCAWRAVRRSRQRADFWRWVWGCRRRSRPLLLAAITAHAGGAELYVIRSPRAVRRFLARRNGKTGRGRLP